MAKFRVGDIVRVVTERHGKSQFGTVGVVFRLSTLNGTGALPVGVDFSSQLSFPSSLPRRNSYAERDLELDVDENSVFIEGDDDDDCI